MAPRSATCRAPLHCQPPVDAEKLLVIVRGSSGWENGLHRTLDVQFREDGLHTGHGLAVVGILCRAALP